MQYTKIDSGFIYSTVYDNRFKLLKIDNYKNQQEDFHLSKHQIAQLILSTPDFLDRAYNFLDVDFIFKKIVIFLKIKSVKILQMKLLQTICILMMY